MQKVLCRNTLYVFLYRYLKQIRLFDVLVDVSPPNLLDVCSRLLVWLEHSQWHLFASQGTIALVLMYMFTRLHVLGAKPRLDRAFPLTICKSQYIVVDGVDDDDVVGRVGLINSGGGGGFTNQLSSSSSTSSSSLTLSAVRLIRGGSSASLNTVGAMRVMHHGGGSSSNITMLISG